MEVQNFQSKVSIETITKAVEALLQWKQTTTQKASHKPQLLPSDEFLYLVLNLTKIPPKPRTNAFKIPLPNPLYTPQTNEFCLFVHDTVSKEIKQKVQEGGVPVSKVIGLSKLRKEYKSFEQRRKLCDSYDLFFADKRVVGLLGRAIGKCFYKKRKVPVPVEVKGGDLKGKIERVCGSGLLYLGSGSCCVVKVAKGSMSKGEIVENVGAAVEGVVGVLGKWGSVRGLHLKFGESVALPVYQKVPELGLKIKGLSEENDNVVVTAKEKEEMKGKKEKVVKKKGRIHEVMYLDDGGMVGEDDGEDEEIEDVGSVGKKRKKEVKKVEKVEKVKKKGVKGLKEKKDKSSPKKDKSSSKKVKRSKVSV